MSEKCLILMTDVSEGVSVELLVLQVRPRRVHEVDGVEGEDA